MDTLFFENSMIGTIIVYLMFPFLILMVASMWKIFEKAGIKGVYSLVPGYNLYLLLKIAERSPFNLLLVLVIFIPYLRDWTVYDVIATILSLYTFPMLGGLFGIIFNIIVGAGLSGVFNKGNGFTVGLVLLPFVFYPILAFGGAKYESSDYIPED